MLDALDRTLHTLRYHTRQHGATSETDNPVSPDSARIWRIDCWLRLTLLHSINALPRGFAVRHCFGRSAGYVSISGYRDYGTSLTASLPALCVLVLEVKDAICSFSVGSSLDLVLLSLSSLIQSQGVFAPALDSPHALRRRKGKVCCRRHLMPPRILHTGLDKDGVNANGLGAGAGGFDVR